MVIVILYTYPIKPNKTHVCTHGHTHLIVSNDDYTSVSMTLDTFTKKRPRQCFSISITNDAITERTEDFTARLTLIPASVATINASRIIVDPPETTVRITDNDVGKCQNTTCKLATNNAYSTYSNI